MTISLAPPCRGPYSVAQAAAEHEYGSACDDPTTRHRRGGAILLVIGVEDEQDVEGAGQGGVGVEPGLGHLPHHRQEVGCEVEGVVGVDEGHAHREAVGGGGQGGHLGDEPDDLAATRVGIEDLLGVEVERRQRRHRRHEHPHGMGVVVEALQETLSYVLVDIGVVCDLVAPGVEVGGRRQLPVQEQVGDLEIVGMLGEFGDLVAAIAQDPGVPVDEGHRALARRGGDEARVVEPDAGEELAPLARRHAAVADGDLELIARPVVDDGDALCHDARTLLCRPTPILWPRHQLGHSRARRATPARDRPRPLRAHPESDRR